jgi:hypothetical protein
MMFCVAQENLCSAQFIKTISKDISKNNKLHLLRIEKLAHYSWLFIRLVMLENLSKCFLRGSSLPMLPSSAQAQAQLKAELALILKYPVSAHHPGYYQRSFIGS